MLVPVTIREVMTEAVETIAPETLAIDAAKVLRDRDIGSVVVVDGGDPVGIVTESDMVALLADRADPDTLTAADCMAGPLVTVDVEDDISDAVAAFREHRIKKLPVTDDGELVGIVTTTDLSYYLPHLGRAAAAATDVDRGDRHERTRVDTAYENDDWKFKSLGTQDDGIDLGDVVQFSKTLSRADVESFAEASGDTNRLHLDDEYAKGTRFGRSIAHGTLVAGTISAALARLPGLIVYLSQETSYLGPVDIGDRVTAECEVVEDIGNGRYRLTTTVTTEDDTEVIDGEAVVLADDIPDTA